jgi:predicted acylesterase/phospholipase RssA
MVSMADSIIFQSAKLSDRGQILQELAWAKARVADHAQIDRIYGVSGGAFVALAFALRLAAERDPRHFSATISAIDDLIALLEQRHSQQLRRLKPNPLYGFYQLSPLRRWLESTLQSYGYEPGMMLSALPVALYLCAGDQDGTLTLFGRPNPELQFDYSWVRVGPPKDAPVVDTLIAALSTSISTEPALVNGSFYRDCRPAINDTCAIVADLEASSPRPIWIFPPHTPPPPWRLNWITSSFIMHRHHEHNQSVLSRYYVDLLERHHMLKQVLQSRSGKNIPIDHTITADANVHLTHVDLPYIGSTEAFTNMRQSVAQKEELMTRFIALLKGQFDHFDFSQPTNVIYGAGGFSGILAGLVTTRRVEVGFLEGGGRIEQIYGVSAGVLNGFFHAVQVAAQRHPEHFTPAASNALNDLELFFEDVSPRKIARLNLNPRRLWQGWANLKPLQAFLTERLGVYTGSTEPEKLTFNDIQLPLTVTVARDDGFTDFLGMTRPERYMRFAGAEIRVLSAPIVKALIAGWSMNTYIQPTKLGDQTYRDGGGSFYDPALFVVCMDPQLQNLLNIHLDEPEGHSYNLPPRPNLLRLLFDTHNYNFPEERRRMRRITDLLFEHFALRKRAERVGIEIPTDFRQVWHSPEPPLERILATISIGIDEER